MLSLGAAPLPHCLTAGRQRLILGLFHSTSHLSRGNGTYTRPFSLTFPTTDLALDAPLRPSKHLMQAFIIVLNTLHEKLLFMGLFFQLHYKLLKNKNYASHFFVTRHLVLYQVLNLYLNIFLAIFCQMVFSS